MEATKLRKEHGTDQEQTRNETKQRGVAGIVNSIETLEGGGFLVRRPFPQASFSEFDPFLLLDEMGPMDVAPGEAKGAPDHPHRGFETVTYLLSGEMEHKDSRGHASLCVPSRRTTGTLRFRNRGADDRARPWPRLARRPSVPSRPTIETDQTRKTTLVGTAVAQKNRHPPAFPYCSQLPPHRAFAPP